MELLAGIAAFLGIVDSIYSLIGKREDVSEEEMQKVCVLLNDVGELIKEVADELEQNRYPHEKCSIMFEYMNRLKSKLQGKLSDTELQQMQENIEQCYRVEQLLGQLNQLTYDVKEYNIGMMRSISGWFIGVSKLL